MSLSTSPSRTIPQWPCDVYSHRQTSVITTSSGWASFSARTAIWTTPSGSYAPDPASSLDAGIPNRITRPDAHGPELGGLADELRDREALDARHRGHLVADPLAAHDEQGLHQVVGREIRLAHQLAQSGRVRRSLRMRVAGKLTPVILGTAVERQAGALRAA